MVTERVAAYDWDVDTLQPLLRRVSSAMAEEVDHLRTMPEHRPDMRRAPT